MPKAQIVTVTAAESGQKLVRFLERRLTGDVPRPAIQRWIRKGQVRVDKGRKKPFDRVNEGQQVRIPPYTPGEEPVQAAPSQGNLAIAFEDEHTLAIAKPAGLPVHGGDKVSDSVAARLSVLYPDPDFKPTLAHRLDRDTSGLLLVAKDYPTLRRLNDLFAAGGIGKLYLAWVRGRWPGPDETLLEDQLEKSGSPGAEKVRPGSGKTALARVTCLAADERQSLMAIRLLTGRTHQIRVQLASRGHPIVGDAKYGRKTARISMLLHCLALRVEDKSLSLPPVWDAPWAVPPHLLAQALALLEG